MLNNATLMPMNCSSDSAEHLNHVARAVNRHKSTLRLIHSQVSPKLAELAAFAAPLALRLYRAADAA